MIKAALIGASGYSGRELLNILSGRDDVIIEQVYSYSSASGNGSSSYNGKQLKHEKYGGELNKPADVVFVSVPAGESMKIVPGILESGAKVIDLGGDFRLKNEKKYDEYYKIKHQLPELLGDSVYGLTEIYKNEIINAKLVANPGCYPTGILLALIPSLRSDIISGTGIVINSLSGVTGAGKKSAFEYSFSEVNENVRAYKITEHQHIPEIEQVLQNETKGQVQFSFIPHLVPLNRGIYTTIVTDLKREVTEEDLYNMYEQFYINSPFIRIKKNVPQLKDIVNTNFCDIHFELDTQSKKLIFISTIDNLIKGAAGQAIQNMNIMFGLPETIGFFKKEKQYV